MSQGFEKSVEFGRGNLAVSENSMTESDISVGLSFTMRVYASDKGNCSYVYIRIFNFHVVWIRSRLQVLCQRKREGEGCRQIHEFFAYHLSLSLSLPLILLLVLFLIYEQLTFFDVRPFDHSAILINTHVHY